MTVKPTWGVCTPEAVGVPEKLAPLMQLERTALPVPVASHDSTLNRKRAFVIRFPSTRLSREVRPKWMFWPLPSSTLCFTTVRTELG